MINPAYPDALRLPTHEQLVRYAERQHLDLPPSLIREEVRHIRSLLQVFERLDQLEERQIPLRYADRDPGRVPTDTDDPYNAAIRFCGIEGAVEGRLSGMRVAIKDNIAVAGVPMTNGARGPAPVMPAEDAVVVERLLDAGATIVAKTNINAADFGVTLNPIDPRFWAGGSSSGSAAAVASGLSDAAIGADQGGSVRIPAAWCGIVGMKATHGLVPSHGLSCWGSSLDHLGPMTETVYDNAVILEVIAGSDWRDPQCIVPAPKPGDYTSGAHAGVSGLRIGVVAESLAPTGCAAATLVAFEQTQRTLADLGADLVPVSVPLWSSAPGIWLAQVTLGLSVSAETLGLLGASRVDMNVLAAVAARYRHGNREPFGERTLPLMFEHLRQAYGGRHLARAQNLRLELARQLDRQFQDVDLLITPTTPTGPTRLETAEDPRADGSTSLSVMTEPRSMIFNSCALNLTGHPALTVPAGLAEDGLPAALQVIGRRLDEATVYRAGFAFEATCPAIER